MATIIYAIVLIIIFLFPPIGLTADNGLWGFMYIFDERMRALYISQPTYYSEIIIVSLIYFAFMLFVIKKRKFKKIKLLKSRIDELEKKLKNQQLQTDNNEEEDWDTESFMNHKE